MDLRRLRIAACHLAVAAVHDFVAFVAVVVEVQGVAVVLQFVEGVDPNPRLVDYRADTVNEVHGLALVDPEADIDHPVAYCLVAVDHRIGPDMGHVVSSSAVLVNTVGVVDPGVRHTVTFLAVHHCPVVEVYNRHAYVGVVAVDNFLEPPFVVVGC